MSTTTVERRPQAYMNPYLAGIGLGLVLLAAFVLVGRGLGATGAFNSLIAWVVDGVAPEHARNNEFMAGYLNDDGSSPLKSWLLFEVVGLFAGAMFSGLLAGRARLTTEKGPRVSVRTRLAMAFAGGVLMAFGAALARGCTSGQALTGGALLNLGSWAFMLMVFAGAYAVAYFVRWQWR
ncbi:MAG TPA: YeeE/YedE thiosulfate transporter family protein [Vicinamibacterales bacterium]|nr:YeeE/YedE thiosulfate transporter family protein [Vicinamibacterales bacterium]